MHYNLRILSPTDSQSKSKTPTRGTQHLSNEWGFTKPLKLKSYTFCIITIQLNTNLLTPTTVWLACRSWLTGVKKDPQLFVKKLYFKEVKFRKKWCIFIIHMKKTPKRPCNDPIGIGFLHFWKKTSKQNRCWKNLTAV